MKILHLTTVARSHAYLLLPQLQALKAAGHDVVAVSAPGPDVVELDRRGIRHRPLLGSTRGFDLLSDLRAARSFASIVRDERPDVVHTHNPKPGVYGRIIARSLGVPTVVNTVHGLFATPDDSLARRATVYGLEALAARFSHLELVQNVEDVDLMTRTGLAPSGKIHHLGNGIDLSTFDLTRTGKHRQDVRRELGVEPDEPVVMSVGRLVAEKGFRELIQASKSICEKHTLVLVGPSDPEKADALSPEVLADAESHGVRVLGDRNDVDRLLSAADVFVLASYREGFPRAAMEAAASSLPIVATDIRGCRQVVDHEISGYLVPRGEVAPLAEAVSRLVRDRELRRQMGKAGRAKAEAEFDQNDVMARLIEAYAGRGVPFDQQPNFSLVP